MNLGDVFAVFAVLATLGIALPALLLTWSLLLPGTVLRAQVRLGQTPWRCFWLGGIGLALCLLPSLVLVSTRAGPLQLAGWGLITLLLTLASVGTAGLAALMGERLRAGGVGASTHGALLWGIIALELAAVFPALGWFIALPLIIVTSLGAAGFGLLHWLPSERLVSTHAAGHEATHAA